MRSTPAVVLALFAGCAHAQGVLPNRVASGDVKATSAVLWGAPDPGASSLRFQWSTDPAFTTIDGSITKPVSARTGAPTKAVASGLQPATQYYYRVVSGSDATDAGTFATPARNGKHGVTFGVSGDWRGEIAPYPAVSNAASANLDFFVALGDTIYADFPSPAVPSPQAETIAEFRAKHAEVYGARFGLNALGDLRASTAFFATIDDHEVTNDFAGGAAPSSDPRFAGDPAPFINQTELYSTGLRAFREYNPIRNRTYSGTGDARFDGAPKLYREQTFGKDAAAFILDARSFRDEALQNADITDLNDVARFLTESFDPTRTMLGGAQIDDLKAGLQKAQDTGVTWKFVHVPEPIQNLGPLAAADRFEGYAAERTELLRFINDNNIENVVFVAADIHGTVINNLTYQEVPGGPQFETGALEVTTGSVAFDAPFGPTVLTLALANGLIDQATFDFVNAQPAPARDQFIKGLIDQFITPFGYSPIGLQDSTRIDAELLAGDYLATQYYGWTEFDVDPLTQALTVTTWGIDPYTAADVLADPDAILALTPSIVSQFRVNPVPAPGGAGLLLVAARATCRRRR